MTAQRTVLLVSLDDGLIEAARTAFGHAGDYRLVVCADGRTAASRLGQIEVHLLVADCQEAATGSAELLKGARVTHPQVPRLLIATAATADHGAEAALQSAAYLFLLKPVLPAQLGIAVKRALELNELSRRHRVLSRELRISMDDDIFGDTEKMSVKGGVSQFEKLVYASPRMAELTEHARQAAATDLPVLIHGETGTGKELLARAIHFNSRRMDAALLVQNCGGMSDETLHSELFGHVRGAFTGAISDRLGLFRAAEGGTVFLDEISEVSRNFQVSLLRFLQEGEVKPLGSDSVAYSDVRIVAASNRSLEEMVERGEFRRDLYYRLKGFTLLIPPLRDRPEDIPVLAEFFLEKYAGVVGRRVMGITRSVLELLARYRWPGNVRELETEVQRMVAVADHGGYISERHLSPTIRDLAATAGAPQAPAIEGANLKEMVENLERRVVRETLTRTRWNQSQAASELGLSRVGLANKIKRYNLQAE
ncbi:sigma-54 dependent transcriptional regulator [Paralimibaculum aggregatum]|uniref:Sigma-54 dependent transcriptional regulator n=1 Tax=Paralimibaculum aggregatum TaxID=3036245 RepID=A0ABQ6LMH9_9RHOB|nr:sigma-54 dependent transcriptional regulator [Limibaculum sp. NKW23]GMG81490.1 sigma-54 dependent transcriptional regulator [Limibaculum sp. NKW23]